MNFEYGTIVLSVIGAVASLYIAITTISTRNRRIEKLFNQAYADENVKAVIEAEKVLALENLKTKNRQKLLAGIKYIEILGEKEPFYEGFDALAVELTKRKDFETRLRIVKALYRLSVTIEEERMSKK